MHSACSACRNSLNPTCTSSCQLSLPAVSVADASRQIAKPLYRVGLQALIPKVCKHGSACTPV